MITILIKTFKRPEACRRLIESIKRYYNFPIIVAVDDDSQDDFGVETIRLPFDSGLSAGRNALVEACKTPYCVIIDDDCVFTEKTDLEGSLETLKQRDLDILQFTIPGLDYKGIFQTNNYEVKYLPQDRNGLYDFCANIFLAKTDKLKECKWDNYLKLGEHFAFFYNHQGKLKIGIGGGVIEHKHIDTPGYQEFRNRAEQYLKSYMHKKGINQRVDLGGNIVNIGTTPIQSAYTLKKAKEILDSLDIPFTLFLGTALGAYRDKTFCPGDEDDMDLAIDKKYYSRVEEITKAFTDNGFTFHQHWQPDDNLCPEIAYKINWHNCYSKIDLFFIDEIDGKIAWRFFKDNAGKDYVTKTIDKRFFEKFEDIEFFNEIYKVPSPIEEYLEVNYGDWKTPIHRDNYSCLENKCQTI